MGMMKNYLLNLLHQCSEENFGQNAIEWAITSGLVRLTYDLDRDIRECMSRYDEIIVGYRHSLVQPMEGLPRQHAPMERAIPHRRKDTEGEDRPIKKKHAA